MTIESTSESETSTEVEMTFGVPLRQNRATVFFRFILVIPQTFVLYFVGLAAFVVLIVGWFAALITGRLPQGIAAFLRGYLRWSTRVSAYMYLMTDKYPPFSLQPSTEFPVDLDVRSGRLNRLAVLFRYFLAIPAGIAVFFLTLGMLVFGIVNWIATLFKGEQPQMFFRAYAAGLRFATRFNGYFYMLTSYYPAKLMGDEVPDGAIEPTPETPEPSGLIAGAPDDGASESAAPLVQEAATAQAASVTAHGGDGSAWTIPAVDGSASGRRWSLVLSAGARKLVIAFFVIGVVGGIGYGVGLAALLSRAASTNQAVTAQNQTIDAYNVLTVNAQSFAKATSACATLTTGEAAIVECFESTDAKFATALNTYANELSTINFPASVSSEAAAAHSAATAASATMTSLSTAGPGLASYQAAVTSANLQSVLGQIDSTTRQLNTALLGI